VDNVAAQISPVPNWRNIPIALIDPSGPLERRSLMPRSGPGKLGGALFFPSSPRGCRSPVRAFRGKSADWRGKDRLSPLFASSDLPRFFPRTTFVPGDTAIRIKRIRWFL